MLIRIEAAKGNKITGYICFHIQLLKDLRDYYKQYKPENISWSYTRKQYSVKALGKVVINAAEKAGINIYIFHIC